MVCVCNICNKKSYNKDLNKLIINTKKKLIEEKKKIFRKIAYQKNIEYKNKKIIIYMTEDKKAYFDINHIINLFNAEPNKDKYYEYKNDISLYDFRDNEHGGFYIKEFITQEVFYKMLLHSNNSFSNKFKDDIAKILDELTNNGNLMIYNGDLKLVNDDLKLVNDNKNLVDIYYTQTFNNNELVSFIKEMIFKFKNTNWTKYYKKNVMYLFVTTLDDPNNLNRILCKIGFTSDLIGRFRGLEYEYKCKFHLIGVKLVERVQDEKEFHTQIKIQYPDLSVKMKIDSHDKDEIYVFDINLYKLFLEYKDKGVFNEEELDEESKQIISNYFDNIEERFELELIKKQNERFNKINNEYEKETIIKINETYYNFVLERDKLKYDFELKIERDKLKYDFELKIADKQNENLRLQIELAQIKNK